MVEKRVDSMVELKAGGRVDLMVAWMVVKRVEM